MDFFDSVISSLVPFLLDLGDAIKSVGSFIDSRLPPGRFNSAVPFLELILPNQIAKWLGWGFYGVLLVIGVFLMFTRYSNRKRIYAGAFKDVMEIEDDDVSFHWHRVVDELLDQLKEIESAHSESALAAFGENIDFSRQRISENVESRAYTLVKAAGQGSPVDAANWVWPPQIVTIVRLELSGTAGERKLQLDCIFTGKGPEKFIPVEVDSNGDNPAGQLLANLAYRIMIARSQPPITQKYPRGSQRRRLMMALSRLPIIWKHATGSLGTGHWKALRAFTEALRLWGDFGIGKPNYVENVRAKLKACIGYDPGYALAHYNLGVLSYLPQTNPGTNNDAREYFLKAAELAMDSGDRPMEGMAEMGVSRCYSQDVHRWGRTKREFVEKARKAADKAGRLLPHDPRTMYASAFAWHCTEDLEDIKKGRTIYEKIIKKYPDKYSSVYNNLGYILMVGGERIQGKGNDEEANREAKVWWDRAERNMKKALAFETRTAVGIRYTNANLGNLHRLRGCYDKAFDYYEKALEDDPEYTSGLNELARLYFELDDMAQGFHYHERALYTLEEPTTDENHEKLKLMREVHEFLKKKGHPAAGEVGSLYEECSKEEWPRDAEPWLKELARILNVDAE